MGGGGGEAGGHVGGGADLHGGSGTLRRGRHHKYGPNPGHGRGPGGGVLDEAGQGCGLMGKGVAVGMTRVPGPKWHVRGNVCRVGRTAYPAHAPLYRARIERVSGACGGGGEGGMFREGAMAGGEVSPLRKAATFSRRVTHNVTANPDAGEYCEFRHVQQCTGGGKGQPSGCFHPQPTRQCQRASGGGGISPSDIIIVPWQPPAPARAGGVPVQ